MNRIAYKRLSGKRTDSSMEVGAGTATGMRSDVIIGFYFSIPHMYIIHLQLQIHIISILIYNGSGTVQYSTCIHYRSLRAFVKTNTHWIETVFVQTPRPPSAIIYLILPTQEGVHFITDSKWILLYTIVQLVLQCL